MSRDIFAPSHGIARTTVGLCVLSMIWQTRLRSGVVLVSAAELFPARDATLRPLQQAEAIALASQPGPRPDRRSGEIHLSSGSRTHSQVEARAQARAQGSDIVAFG